MALICPASFSWVAIVFLLYSIACSFTPAFHRNFLKFNGHHNGPNHLIKLNASYVKIYQLNRTFTEYITNFQWQCILNYVNESKTLLLHRILAQFFYFQFINSHKNERFYHYFLFISNRIISISVKLSRFCN